MHLEMSRKKKVVLLTGPTNSGRLGSLFLKIQFVVCRKNDVVEKLGVRTELTGYPPR